MSESEREADDLPQAVARTKSRWSLSVVWIIPLVAALIGGWLAVKTYLEKGPTIVVSFKTAEGLEANKTRVKYKDVEIGEVRAIRLDDDHSKVLVTIELAKYIEPMLVEDSRFWVVRTRVGAGGVSGLSTLFSGAYIGMDFGSSKKPTRTFVGRETPVVVATDEPGRRFILRGESLGSLDVGGPIYYRRVKVGTIGTAEFDKEGKNLSVRVFVAEPYDRFVTTNTRFWHASGVDVTLNAEGLNVRTESLAAILAGGVAFETPPEQTPSPRADALHEFKLSQTREEAMRSPDQEVIVWMAYFDQSVRGVMRGAPVEFRGVPVGEIADASLDYDPTTHSVRTAVTFNFYPGRLWSRVRKTDAVRPAETQAERLASVNGLINRGLRAQLRTANILTGHYYLALDFVPQAKKAKMDWAHVPPVMPSEPGPFDDMQAKVASIIEKIDRIPYAEIGADARKTLASLDTTLKGADGLLRRADTELIGETKATLESTRSAIAAAKTAIENADRLTLPESPLQTDAREALRELTRAAEAIRVLADLLERHPEVLLRGKAEEKQP